MILPSLPNLRSTMTIGLLGLLISQLAPAQTYTITSLPPLAGDAYCGAYALNESGQAAGNSGNRAVVWTEGVPQNIQTIGSFSVAFGLNDLGHAAGDISPSVSNSGAFIWRGGFMSRIVAPDGRHVFEAYAMNNSDTVVGTGGATFGWRWDNGSFASLGLPTGYWEARPQAINNLGIVAGRVNGPNGPQPVTWIGTTPFLAPLPVGLSQGVVYGINDLGLVVGSSFNDFWTTKPFAWSGATGAMALPLPSETTGGYAWAVNNVGDIIGDAGGQPVLWRKNDDGQYEAVLIVEHLADAAGWTQLDLYAINEAGQIAGDGILNGESRGFILTPGPTLTLNLRTDLDRSGTTDFASASDATAVGNPFYFWTNDDHDTTGEDGETGPIDSADDRIFNPVLVSASGENANAAVVRDLEDFARLAFKLTLDLRTALEAGAKLRLEATGAGAIHLFSTPSTDDETRYLTDEPFAVSLITNVATDVALRSAQDSNGITLWENIETLIKSSDWESGRLSFLWEGVTPGACVLTLKLAQADGTEIASAPVHISLRPVRDFFEGVRVVPANGFPPPWETNGQTPTMSWQRVHARTITQANEQNVDVVWVHGWRMTEYDRQNWAEMMFKRLWHAGYRGRLHAFTWPTYSGDDFIFKVGPAGLLSFDRSEFRAWKSGVSLQDYLELLRLEHPDGRLVTLAHSMGNVVCGEALRRGAPADLQIMMQAAVSAGCYDARSELDDPVLVSKDRIRPTPDFDVELGYRGFLCNITVPTINYHNTEDFALGLWFANQLTKPDNPIGKGDYDYLDGRPGLYGGKKLLREVTDVHESLAFLARSRTLAVGAQPLTSYSFTGNPLGPFSNRLDLHAEPYNFSSASNEHSAQFNRPIQRLMIPFYTQLRRTIANEPQ